MMMNFLTSQLSREPCPWLTGRAASRTPLITWSATTVSTLPPGAGVLFSFIGQIFPFYLLPPLQVRVEHLVSGGQEGRAGTQASHGGGGGPAAGACPCPR